MKKFLTLIFACSFLLSFGQSQRSIDAFKGVTTGTDTYSVTINSILDAAPYDGQKLSIRFGATNTGASTLAISGAGTISYPVDAITLSGSALGAGDIVIDQYIGLVYYLVGTSWQLQRPGGGGSMVTSVEAESPLSSSGGATPTITITSPLPIVNGGTNSSVGMSGSSIIITDGTDIIQGAAGISTQVLHGNAGGAPTYSQVDLTSDVTAVLPVANGGTNSTLGSWNLDGNTVGSEKWIGTIDNFDFPIRTNNAIAVNINKTGLVGIGTGTVTPNEQLEITKNFRLPTSTSTTGIVYSGANRYIHNLGTNNFFAGVDAGNLTLTATNSTALGVKALKSLTSGGFNTAIGNLSLEANTTGSQNTALGYASMETGTANVSSCAFGVFSLDVASASANSAFGHSSGKAITSSGKNSLFGFEAGKAITTGTGQNIMMGYQAGSQITTGSANIILGYQAAAAEGNMSNILWIANSITSDPIIFGDMTATFLGFGTTSPTAKIHIKGTGSGSATTDLAVHNSTGASNSLIIKGDTMVGIGIANPTAGLHLLEGDLGEPVYKFSSLSPAFDEPTEILRQGRIVTTDATLTTLATIPIDVNAIYTIESIITARRTGGSAGTADDGAVYRMIGSYTTKAGTVTLMGALDVYYFREDQVAFNGTQTISGSNVLINITGALNNTMSWHVSNYIYMTSK